MTRMTQRRLFMTLKKMFGKMSLLLIRQPP